MGTTSEINQPRLHQPDIEQAQAGRSSNERPFWYDNPFRRAYIWFGVFAVPLMGILAFTIFQPIQVLPRISLAPGFSFTDQDGNQLTNEDLRGKFVFYTFSYADCQSECGDPAPAMAEIQAVVSRMDTRGVPVEFVTISFDPARDTPVRLQEYAARVGADTSSWHFVTGDPVRLKNVIGGGFSAFYEQKDDGSFRFDPTFALVDGWGILRSKYKNGAPDPTIVERDINLLLDELENSDGAGRFAYEAAHLFLCYPD